MKDIILAPSILSADFNKLGKEVLDTRDGGAQWLHFDVMDGHFVPEISFGMPVLRSLSSLTDQFLDVHLMVDNPDRHIETIAVCGADGITVHAETAPHLHRTLQLIHSCGKKAGVALNPATSLSALDYVLEDVDLILIMTVNPGFGGQSFIPTMMEKIRTLRNRLDEMGLYDVHIQVDGGIKEKNILEVAQAGADVFVAGSAVFGTDTRAKTENFMKLIRG